MTAATHTLDLTKPITDGPALREYVTMTEGEDCSVEDWKADNTVCCAECGARYIYNWSITAIERGDDGEFRCDDCAEGLETEPSYASQNRRADGFRVSL